VLCREKKPVFTRNSERFKNILCELCEKTHFYGESMYQKIKNNEKKNIAKSVILLKNGIIL